MDIYFDDITVGRWQQQAGGDWGLSGGCSTGEMAGLVTCGGLQVDNNAGIQNCVEIGFYSQCSRDSRKDWRLSGLTE